MKLKMLRTYLDFEKGKTYDIEQEDTANYWIAMSIAKKVVAKDGEPALTAAQLKAQAEKEAKEKAEADARESAALQEALEESTTPEQDFSKETPDTDIPSHGSEEATKERNEADKIISGQTLQDDAETADTHNQIPDKKADVKPAAKASTKATGKNTGVKPETKNDNDPDDLLGLFNS